MIILHHLDKRVIDIIFLVSQLVFWRNDDTIILNVFSKTKRKHGMEDFCTRGSLL